MRTILRSYSIPIIPLLQGEGVLPSYRAACNCEFIRTFEKRHVVRLNDSLGWGPLTNSDRGGDDK